MHTLYAIFSLKKFSFINYQVSKNDKNEACGFHQMKFRIKIKFHYFTTLRDHTRSDISVIKFCCPLA